MDPYAEYAFTIMNGFCSEDCQDVFMSSLLFTSDEHFAHPMPMAGPEIFETHPFSLDFFNKDMSSLESHRSWIFQCDNIPATFPMMSTYYQWTPTTYHILRLNNENVFRKHFALLYHSVGHNHDGQPCLCPHEFRTQMAGGWDLFQYRLEDTTLFCLTMEGRRYSPPRLQRMLTNRNVFEGVEDYSPYTDYTEPSPEPPSGGGHGHGATAGLGYQGSFNPLGALYEELFSPTSEAQLKFDATLCFQPNLHLICIKRGILLQHWADPLPLHMMEHFMAKASEENNAIWGGRDRPNAGCVPYAVPFFEEGHKSFCFGSGRLFLELLSGKLTASDGLQGSQGEEGTSVRVLSDNYDQVLSHLNTTLQNLKGGIILPLCIQEVSTDDVIKD